jgi:UDP-N-acetyl-2-amino-2-deoxyglucuronate dehydrogenase
MQKLRFAIIGCGRIAKRHAEHIHEKGILLAVCDIIKEKADNLAAAYNARAWYSIDDLLQNEETADVIVICTSNGLHAAHTIKSLEAGFHVLCEKPMALCMQDGEEMIKAAKTAGRQLFIVKQNRYNPPVIAVKEAIDQGKMGRLYSLQLSCFWNRGTDYYKDSWRGTLQQDGGTLFTQFSHFIDLMCWMVGDVDHVQAILANYAHKGVIEFEDTGVVLLQFCNGAIGSINYTVNSYRKNMEGSLTIFGENGTVKIGGQYLNTLEYQEIAGYRIGDLPAGKEANQYGTYEGSMSNHDKVYDNVVNVLQFNKPAANSLPEALQTVAIIEKIYKQAIRL